MSKLIAILAATASAGAVQAQRLAVITPDNSIGSRTYAAKFETDVASKLKLVDDAVARSAFEAAGVEQPFNLTADTSKRLGQAIGCDFILLVRSADQRRSSFERQEYYEAYGHLFLISTRTGRLVKFELARYEEDRPELASSKLISNIPEVGAEITAAATDIYRREMSEPDVPSVDGPPVDGSAAAKNFKAPVPFRRVKPEYTDAASMYNVTATVEVTVDLSADGKVMRTEVTRWAGYGLDDSAVQAVESMNWRPAERDGKFIPMRFVVRYNFKKPEKSDPQTAKPLYKN